MGALGRMKTTHLQDPSWLWHFKICTKFFIIACQSDGTTSYPEADNKLL
jgi:hypothetical protein